MPIKRTQRKIRNKRRKVGRKSRRVKKKLIGGGKLVPIYHAKLKDGQLNPITYKDSIVGTELGSNPKKDEQELYIDEASFKKIKDNINNVGLFKTNIFNLKHPNEIKFYLKVDNGGFQEINKDIRNNIQNILPDSTSKGSRFSVPGQQSNFTKIAITKENQKMEKEDYNDNEYYLISKVGLSGFRPYTEEWQDPSNR